MPFVVRSDSENEAELVFLSPDEEVSKPPESKKVEDQGASPVLRRSNRKRKSTAAHEDMPKDSGSKKKKAASPEAAMPKIPRTPSGAEDRQDKDKDKDTSSSKAFEAMLLAMEARLGAKMEKATSAAEEAVRLSRETKDNLEAMEVKVNQNEEAVMEALRATEDRIMDRVDKRVQEMVDKQLRTAGFDPDLTASELPVRDSLRHSRTTGPTYASTLKAQTLSLIHI